MKHICPLCAAKDERIDELEERILQLTAAGAREGGWHPPLEWSLTGKEAVVIAVLFAREIATKEAIMAALYGDKACDAEIAEPKIVDVFICKARKKLEPFGIEIKTVWGKGYAIERSTRERVLAAPKQAGGGG